MASTLECTTTRDIPVCSICFEEFKTPRYLPCKHSFCHNCLCSYIASQCDPERPPLGFLCPFCREFVPNISCSVHPEEWVTHFPENHVLEKYVRNPGQTYCEACLRESEEEEATDFCFNCNEKLCAVCRKYHKRNFSTQKHKIVPLTETGKMGFAPSHAQEQMCSKHHDSAIEYFCNDHMEPCCNTCVCTTHRTCKQVKTVKETASRLKGESGNEFYSLLNHVEILEEKMSYAKQKQENYIRELEEKADQISIDTEKVYDDAVNHLHYLKNKYLTNMTIGLKKCKEKYEKEIRTLDDGIKCAKYCAKNIEKTRENISDAELVVKYHAAKKCFDRLKCFDFTQIKADMKEVKPDILKNIMALTIVPDVTFSEEIVKILSDERDVNRVQLREKAEFTFEQTFVRDGNFRSNGNFVLPTTIGQSFYSKGNYENNKCLVYNDTGLLKQEVHLMGTPFGIVECHGNLFVSCTSEKRIKVLGPYVGFKRYLNVDQEIFGITCMRGSLYLACYNKIIKIDTSGKTLKTFETGPTVKYIAHSGSHIVYSNRKTNEVVAVDQGGLNIWRYSCPGLKSPCGLGVDGDDNIYVAGKESDNVHVLNKDGTLIRVFEDIFRPDFMKVDPKRRVCFVSSKRKYLKVYEMI